MKVSATELGQVAAKAAVEAGNVKLENIDAVIYGTVLSVSVLSIYLVFMRYLYCSQ